jgi:hypothetical protein
MKNLKEFDLALCIVLSLPVGILAAMLTGHILFIPVSFIVCSIYEISWLQFKNMNWKKKQ